MLGPTEDCGSNGVDPCAFWEPGTAQPDPAVYGPYTLQPIAGSSPFVTGAAYPFQTSTGGPDDWLLAPLTQEGLHEVALHNVLYAGNDLYARLGVDVGTIDMDAYIDPALGVVEFGSIDADVYASQGSFDLLFTPTLALPDLVAELAGGLETTVSGPFTNLVKDNGQNYSAWDVDNTVNPFLVTVPGTTQIKTHVIMPPAQDADHFLVFDTNNNGVLEQASDTVVGSSGNSTGTDEEIILNNPALGRYFHVIAGYDMEPNTGVNVDWWYSITYPGSLSTEVNTHYSSTVTIGQNNPFDWTSASFVYSLVTDPRAAALHVNLNTIPVGSDVDLYLTDGANNLLASSTNGGNADESIDWNPAPGDIRFGAGETFKVWVHGLNVPTPPINPVLQIETDDLNIWLSSTHPAVTYNSGIAAGETVTLTVNFAKNPWVPGDLPLSARVTVGPTVLPGAFDELITINRSTTPTPKAVFTIDKSAVAARGPYPAMITNTYLGPLAAVLVAPTEYVTYTLTVENVGDAAGDFYLEDYWGNAYFDFDHWITAPASTGAYVAGSWEVIWGADTLAPSASATYQFVTKATGVALGFAYVNYADVYDYNTNEFFMEDGYYAVYRGFSTSATTGLPAFSDKFSSTSVPGKVAPGEIFPYIIALTNPSSIDKLLYVTDPLPPEVNFFFAGSTPGVTYNAVTHTASWSGVVPGNSLATTIIVIMAQAKGSLAEKTAIHNAAYVAQTSGGVPFATLTDDLVVDDGLDPDLHMTKFVDNLVTAAGSVLQYTVVILNTGAQTAEGVHLVDTLSPYLEIIPASLTGGAYLSGGAVHWDDDVPVGVPFIITYQAKVIPGWPKVVIINAAELTQDGETWWLFESAVSELLNGSFIWSPFFAR